MKHLLSEMEKEEQEELKRGGDRDNTNSRQVSGLNMHSTLQQTLIDMDEMEDTQDFELDDRFMFKLISTLRRGTKPDSATNGLAMGLAQQMCSQIGHSD